MNRPVKMPNLFSLFLLFLPFLFLSNCHGQEQSASSQKIDNTEFHAFPDLQKLQDEAGAQIAEFVVEIFEDSKGHLWFGTMSKGAARFDGKTLKYFSTEDGLVDNTVVSIEEDREGRLWFGTHNGASRFDGTHFKHYQKAEGLHGEGCQILQDKNGTIWAGTNHGLFRFDGNHFVEFQLPQPDLKDPSYKWELGKIWSIMEDSKGQLWFARDGYGACRYNGQSFKHFTKKDGLCSNNVCSIVEDAEGNIWFGTLSSDWPQYINEGGLSRFDGQQMSTFTALAGLHNNDIYTIEVDKKGKVWIGAIGHGAYYYDSQNFSLFNQTDREDLIKRFGIQAFLEDQKGRRWFGFSGGLFLFDGTSFINRTKKDLTK